MGCLVLTMIGTLGGCSSKETKPVAKVGDEVIEQALVEELMNGSKGSIKLYFEEKYGVDLSEDPDAWTKAYGSDGTPLNCLKEEALEQAVRIKTEMAYAKEKGLVKTTDFDELMNYQPENITEAFCVPVEKEEIPTLELYDTDVFGSYQEILDYVLSRTVRNDISDQEVKDYVAAEKAEGLKAYIRISEEEAADIELLTEHILSDAQRLSVVRDLIVSDKYEALMQEKTEGQKVERNTDVYEDLTL